METEREEGAFLAFCCALKTGTEGVGFEESGRASADGEIGGDWLRDFEGEGEGGLKREEEEDLPTFTLCNRFGVDEEEVWEREREGDGECVACRGAEREFDGGREERERGECGGRRELARE